MLEDGRFENVSDARTVIFKYIEGYNGTDRKHSSIGYKTRVSSKPDSRSKITYKWSGNPLHLATPQAEWRAENRLMNKLITILVAFAFTSSAMAASYSTKATMTREEQSARYAVAVRVSKLVERDGKVMERVICLPRIICSPGVPAFISSGQAVISSGQAVISSGQAVNPYTAKESVRIDISWPKKVRPDFAVCTVAIKLGDTLVSKTKTKMAVEE